MTDDITGSSIAERLGQIASRNVDEDHPVAKANSRKEETSDAEEQSESIHKEFYPYHAFFIFD